MEHRSETPDQHSLQRLGAYLFMIASVFLLALPLGTCSSANVLESEAADYPEIFDDLGPHLEKYYWDPRRFQPREQTRRALAALENAADEIWVEYSGPENTRARVHVGESSKVVSLERVTNLRSAFAALKGVFRFLERHYDGETPLNDVRFATVNGFLTGLDPHTIVFSRKAFEEFYVHIEGEIYGVGMLVGVRDSGQLTVIQVLKGTPAQRAGFLNGDAIVKIGEESTVNMTVSEAVKKIRGKRGTEVVLTVKREDPKNKDRLITKRIPVVRDRVVIKSVESKLLPDGVGYVKVTNFDKNTVDSLRANLARLTRENGGKALSGLILDLRDNSGGLLKQASDMVDLFIEDGTIYSIADRDGVESFGAQDDGDEPTYPMVVLGNQSSASGAEIVIGALQQNHRALVLGTRTFGKGSVQQLHPLPSTGRIFLQYKAQLKITVSEYLIPGKISIQENGVVPDILAHAVIFGEKDIDLFPNERHGTEKDYKHHIVSKYARHLEPRDRLDYPRVLEVPDDDEPVGDRFMSGDLDPLKDNLVRVAVDVLRLEASDAKAGGDGAGEAPEVDGAAFVAAHRDGLARIREKMSARISELLSERGIDWSKGTNSAAAPNVKVEVSHEFIERPSKDEEDPYPERVLVIKARATNLSDRPVFRLAGVTSAQEFLYNEREFLFGKLAPGASAERTVEAVLRPSSATRSDVFSIELKCPGVAEPFARTRHEVIIPAEDFPEFRYSLTLLDGRSGKPVETLAPGSEARLVARVENTGSAPVRKGVAVLRNESGKAVFLDIGRLEIRGLEPGKTREVEFRFHVREDSDLEKYEFEFGVFGSHYPVGLSRTFTIPAAPAGIEKFHNGEKLSAASIALQVAYSRGGERHTGAPADVIITDGDSVDLSAVVRAEARPFDAWVSVRRLGIDSDEFPDKVFYAESGENGDRLDLSTPVPVKVGQNIISVVAQDARGLTRRQVLYVRRSGASPE